MLSPVLPVASVEKSLWQVSIAELCLTAEMMMIANANKRASRIKIVLILELDPDHSSAVSNDAVRGREGGDKFLTRF